MDKEFLTQIDRLRDLLPDPETEKLDDEVLICECFCVSVRDIRETCADQKEVDIALLQNSLSLGHGCQSCLKNQESWLNKIF